MGRAWTKWTRLSRSIKRFRNRLGLWTLGYLDADSSPEVLRGPGWNDGWSATNWDRPIEVATQLTWEQLHAC